MSTCSWAPSSTGWRLTLSAVWCLLTGIRPHLYLVSNDPPTASKEDTMTNTVQTTVANLLDGLRLVEPFVATKTKLTVLSHVRIVQQAFDLTIDATDMSSWANWHNTPKVGCYYGDFVLPFKQLKDAIAAMPADCNVTITEAGEGKVSVTPSCGGGLVTMTCLPTKDFPLKPAARPEKARFGFEASEIVESLDWVLPAVSEDLTRPVLTGVYFETNADSLVLVSTDSYRLHKMPVVTTSARVTVAKGYIVDGIGLAGVHKAMKKVRGTWGVFLGDMWSEFRSPDAHLAVNVRVIDGQYPNYRQLIPEPVDGFMATVEPKQFADALAACAKIGKRAGAPAILSVEVAGQHDMGVRIEVMDEGSYADAIPCEVEAETYTPKELFEIGVNPGFLLDAVKRTKEVLSMYFLTPLRPLQLFGEDPARMALLMPVRIKD